MIREVLAKSSGASREPLVRGLGRDGMGGVSTTVANATVARPRVRAKRYLEEKRSLIAQLADTAKRRSLPRIPEGLKDILVSAIGDLLAGGYDFEMVRTVAVAALLDYTDVRRYSHLSQLRMRVRAAQSAHDLEEHKRIRREESQAYPAKPVGRAGMVAQAEAMEARGEDAWMIRRALAKGSKKLQCPTCKQTYFDPGDGRVVFCTTGETHPKRAQEES